MPKFVALLRRACRSLGALQVFSQNSRGVAAVEFAVIAPVALFLYFGAVEISDGVMTSRSLSNLTRTMVDLLSQQATTTQTSSTLLPTTAITAATLSNMMAGAPALLYPKSTTSLSITLTALDVFPDQSGKCCNPMVRWSYTQNGTLRPCATPITGTSSTTPGPTVVPSGLLPVGTALAQPLYYLIADVIYTYQPPVASTIISFSPTMRRTEYMMPRSFGQVTAGPLPASGAQYGRVCY